MYGIPFFLAQQVVEMMAVALQPPSQQFANPILQSHRGVRCATDLRLDAHCEGTDVHEDILLV